MTDQPATAKPTLPATHTVVHGDSCASLAKHYYGDECEKHWRKIYDANKPVIGEDPNLIKPGEKLHIPA